MKTIIHIENDNIFSAGWLACHLGLKRDCLNLTGIEQTMFLEGFRMREETADMEDSGDAIGHGGAHIAFLIQATNPKLVPFVRDRVTIEIAP